MTLEELQLELEESDQRRKQIEDLLTKTANALKGDPPPLTLHHWSDLPEMADRAARELAVWRAKQPHLDQLADMLGVCEGVCPLTAVEARLRHLEDLPLCRRQLPDGHVPGNTEEALTAWIRTADDLQDQNRSLRSALAAAQARIAELEGAMPDTKGMQDGSLVRDLRAENARLRRALDAAGLVLGSDDTAPQVAMEREEVK